VGIVQKIVFKLRENIVAGRLVEVQGQSMLYKTSDFFLFIFLSV
jgi:hypothetical protein